jgi:hypothetical protein
MVYFQTKMANFGIFWKGLVGKFWCTSWPFGIFIAILVYLTAIWNVCGHLGIFSDFVFFASRKIWQPRF